MNKLRNYIRTLLALLLFLAPLSQVSAATTGAVLISEIQTQGASSTQEFIELYNDSDNPVDVSTWKVEYFKASEISFVTPIQAIPLHGILPAHAYYLLASANYLTSTANDTFTAPLLANSGGHVRLASADPTDPLKEIVHDQLGWGTATRPEGTAIKAIANGSSAMRAFGVDGHMIDTDDNLADFAPSTTPTPQGFVAAIPDPDPTPVPDPIPPNDQTTDPPVITDPDPITQPAINSDQNNTNTQPPTDTSSEQPPAQQPVSQPVVLAALQINELLPNPAPPATDDSDEFIELYNPNDQPVDLTGYKLQTGNSYSYSYTFTNDAIASHGYKTVSSGDTNLTLANSGGKARLIDPAGNVIAETAYLAAPEGQAWAIAPDGTWHWSIAATPNAENTITAPVIPIKTSTTTAAKKTTTPKLPTTKTAATTAKAVKAATTTKKAPAATSTPSTAQYTAEAVQPTGVHPAVLAAIGLLTLLYAGYEYRHDMANKLYQLRRYREARRINRQSN